MRPNSIKQRFKWILIWGWARHGHGQLHTHTHRTNPERRHARKSFTIGAGCRMAIDGWFDWLARGDARSGTILGYGYDDGWQWYSSTRTNGDNCIKLYKIVYAFPFQIESNLLCHCMKCLPHLHVHPRSFQTPFRLSASSSHSRILEPRPNIAY